MTEQDKEYDKVAQECINHLAAINPRAKFTEFIRMAVIFGYKKGCEITSTVTRDDFMEFFRDNEKLNTLSPDDRIEVFSTILLGGLDITAERLNDLINDYCVEGLNVIETKNISDIRKEYVAEMHEKLGPKGYKELADWAINDFVALYISKIINGE